MILYDLSLAEIAENSGISRQAVRDVIVKAVEQLKFYEDKLGFSEKIKIMDGGISDALSSLEQGAYDDAKNVLKRLKQNLEE